MSNINATVNQMRQLIPSSNPPRKNPFFGTSRVKRGLFDFIGEISKSLFGTATASDISTLQRHMQTLNRNNAKLAKAMAVHEKHLSSFISTVNKRFDNVMNAVEQNHRDAVMYATQAQHSIDAVEHEFMLLG